jgi:hypothetical protein
LRVECEVIEVRPSKSRPGAGPDQASNDHPEPGRRARAGACREPGRTASEGHPEFED